MSIVSGALVDHYRIERPVGSGAFATVYLAHDDRFDDAVAVKVLAENRAFDLEARRRFVEEAQKLRSIQSPSIVAVFDVGETETNQPYMVLAYADRGDLASRWAEHPQQPPSAADLVSVIEFLRSSLTALHTRGLVHRDVKPHNILIASDDTVSEGTISNGAVSNGAVSDPGLIRPDEHLLLGDLGFVKDLEAASGLTVGGGTIAFRAPEQERAVTRIDHRADIYSASAVIAWLMTGASPHGAAGWHEALSGLGHQHPSPSTHALIAELRRGLDVAPHNRPPNVDVWRDALHAALRPPTAASPAPSSNARPVVASAPDQAAHPTPSRRRGRSIGALAIVAIASLAGGGALATWAPWDREATTREVFGESVTEQQVGDQVVSISGPSEVFVDDQVSYAATVGPPAAGVWIRPDGTTTDARQTLAYVARSPGRFTVWLMVTNPGDGPTLIGHHVTAKP